MLRDTEKPKKPPKTKREFTKSEWIGITVSLFIASILFAFGSFGFIPALLTILVLYWIVKNIAKKILKEE